MILIPHFTVQILRFSNNTKYIQGNKSDSALVKLKEMPATNGSLLVKTAQINCQ